MRCAVYVRVSTEMETQNTSIAHQISYFEKYIEERGWSLHKVYQDRESGVQAKNRIGLQQLLSDSRRKMFDAVLTKSISRFARNTLEGLTIIRELKERNIRFITIEDGFDSQAYDEFMLTLLLSMAQKESVKMSERIRFGKLCRAKNGAFNGSTIPYGYKKDGKNKLIPAGDLSTFVVQQIFRMYLEGLGLYKIAKELNEKGYPTPGQRAGRSNSSKLWHQSTLRKILSNPVYMGDMVQNKTKTIDVLTGKRKENQASDHIYVPKTHEAIIDPQIFQSVQKRLERKQQQARTGPQKHLFSNMLVCGECGSKMHFKKDREAYLCGRVNKMGKKMCSGTYISEEMIKTAVCTDLRRLIEKHIISDTFLEEVKFAVSQQRDKKGIRNLNQMIEKSEGKKERLLELLLQKVIDKDCYQKKLKEIQAEIDVFEHRKKILLRDSEKEDRYGLYAAQKMLKMEELDMMTVQSLIHSIKVFKKKKIEIRYLFRV